MQLQLNLEDFKTLAAAGDEAAALAALPLDEIAERIAPATVSDDFMLQVEAKMRNYGIHI